MKRKYFDHFNIAGFTFYEGALAFNQLQIGTALEMKAEPKNRHDENAIAIYYRDYKLGFVPRSKNETMSKIMNSGYNIFELRVQQINAEVHAERQVHVVAFVKDKSKKKK